MATRRSAPLTHPHPENMATVPEVHPCPIGSVFRRPGEKRKRYIYVGRVNPDGSLVLRGEHNGLTRSFMLADLIPSVSMRAGG